LDVIALALRAPGTRFSGDEQLEAAVTVAAAELEERHVIRIASGG
jgi:hypothetical protein